LALRSWTCLLSCSRFGSCETWRRAVWCWVEWKSGRDGEYIALVLGVSPSIGLAQSSGMAPRCLCVPADDTIRPAFIRPCVLPTWGSRVQVNTAQLARVGVLAPIRPDISHPLMRRTRKATPDWGINQACWVRAWRQRN
jgi:hypothetical protein